MKASRALPLALLAALPLCGVARAATQPTNTAPGDAALAAYFKAETARLADRCLADIRTLGDWQARREEYRRQLFDMLGLAPLPVRGDLRPVITGRVEHEHCTVENVHFQSSPGLYVTGNLYLPKNSPRPAPTILYLSGHGPVITNGISYGNKVAYQHHGAWFARHGYVCLVIDTLQLGEILGLHHGTHREGLWWWNSRGYTPAGVEAWNSIRALDYLETRPEVDKTRFGVTGRSGGGAYSWWIAALDDRIKAAAPVAGITDLHNHIVDGTVEGHCDCMFIVNTYRWDYPQVAALVAPRPLLIVNTDADSIFPLDGVQRLHAKVRGIYKLHNADDKLGLVIGPGPHKDTQDLQVPVFRWFNKHLKGEDPLIEAPAVKLFTAQQLKVFKELPADAINTNIHESFVAAAPLDLPKSKEEWGRQRDGLLRALSDKCFAGWPEPAPALDARRVFQAERDGVRFEARDFTSQQNVPLRLYIASGTRFTNDGGRVELNILGDEKTWEEEEGLSFESWLRILSTRFEAELSNELAAARPVEKDRDTFDALRTRLQQEPVLLAWVAPRGFGLTAWSGNNRKQTHIRRRFMLLGQTLDAMRVWDIRRSLQALRLAGDFSKTRITLRASRDLACDALYASLFEPPVDSLDLLSLPSSYHVGPDYLNVLRVLNLSQAVAMAAERSPVVLRGALPPAYLDAKQVGRLLGWPRERLRVLGGSAYVP